MIRKLDPKRDLVFMGRAGPILERDGRLFSVNRLSAGRVEIRYRLDRFSDFEYHGLPHLWPGEDKLEEVR